MSDLHLDPLTGLPAIHDDGTGRPRRMGRLVSSGPMALPDFRTYHAPIPPSEWEDINLFYSFGVPTYDQGQHGSCTGHGACSAFTLIWLMQGEDLLRFSPCYIYGQINGGVDQGASIGSTIDELRGNGVCLESTVPEGMIYASSFPSNADEEASKYKLVEAYKTSDPADVATALQMGYSAAYSVMVGRTFNTFDRYGVVGVDRGPGNHCVCGGGMKKLPTGDWAFITRNSWSTQWGDNGNFLTTEAHMQSQTYFESVVFRSVTPGPNAPALIS